MNRGFYLKLAASNMKKNGRIYTPFLISCICTVMVCYVMNALMQNSNLSQIMGGKDMQMILSLGFWIMCIFSVIFLFYTNSFLMKRRKKEFGVYNILGMEKKHIARVISYETLYIAVISVVVGLIAGILLNKICVLIVLRMIHAEVKLGFELVPGALVYTTVLFAVIFALILLNNIRQVRLTKPIELLRGGNVGEKEPKTKWIMTILGLISLGIGYYIAITTEDPIEAMLLFFVAVVLVMIGTYLLFTSGSITLLKGLRNNKKFYYRSDHFISVSGMIYRMKQNAIGLANICILSTGVLLLISITVSLYAGTEEAITSRYPNDISFTTVDYSQESDEKIQEIMEKTWQDEGIQDVDTENYLSLSMAALPAEHGFEVRRPGPIGSEDNSVCFLGFIVQDDFPGLSETNKLQENQIMMYSMKEEYNQDHLQILGYNFEIVGEIPEQAKLELGKDAVASIYSSYFIVVPDTATLEDIYNKQKESYQEDASDIVMNYSINLPDVKEDEKMEVGSQLFNNLMAGDISTRMYDNKAENANGVRGMYSGFLFLGMLLGILFLIATVLIIYYKQISEGYDDKERYEIMKKVGMSRREVKKTIHSQILTVFFLPLVTAGIHLLVAFPMVKRLLALLSLGNDNLFTLCTGVCFVIFAICYGIIYSVTAKTYYKIVSPEK